mgnify:CR=1 FL=1
MQQVAFGFTEMMSPDLHEGIQSMMENEVASHVTERVEAVSKCTAPRESATQLTCCTSSATDSTRKLLKQSVPLALERGLPPKLIKPVVQDMTQTMSRALTHILVPSITDTLSHNPAEHVACSYCRCDSPRLAGAR